MFKVFNIYTYIFNLINININLTHLTIEERGRDKKLRDININLKGTEYKLDYLKYLAM